MTYVMAPYHADKFSMFTPEEPNTQHPMSTSCPAPPLQQPTAMAHREAPGKVDTEA